MTNEEVIEKHKIINNTVDSIVFEPNSVSRIVVSFTGMQLGNYNKWSWYYQDYQQSTTLFIVFKDDEHLYYLNRDERSVVREHYDFIQHYITKYNMTNKQVITVGSSMGGYAAIYYAFLFDFKLAIASVPIVDYESALLIKPYNTWTRKMDQLGDNWIDLDKFLDTTKSTTKVYLIHGQFPADLSASKKLTRKFDQLGVPYQHDITDGEIHFEYLTRDKLMNIIKEDIIEA
jgi:hypothetical protein